MVIFEKDWLRFPTAQPDYSTKNDSFLRLTSLYRDMGVKNCLFPLLLLNPALKGVDPHSPYLTAEQKELIGVECRYNVWYFLREVVRIPPNASPDPIAYIANRGNIALTWSFLCSIDFALIQPRQTGKSVSTDCLMVWLLFIGASNTKINMITKDDQLRRANVERLKAIRDLLPPYLWVKSSGDSDNQVGMTYAALGNVYRAGVSQNSESGANNLGRGLTSPVTHIDEGPFIKFIGTTFPAALASGNRAREEAKLARRPYGNIFTTTAGKKDDRDGKYMYDLISLGATWDELFMDAFDLDDLHVLVERNRKGRKQLINGTFSHRQLGLTDKWLYDAMANANSSGDAADRDFFNVWTSGTQSSPLTPRLNEVIRNSESEVQYNTITKDSYIFRWHIPEDEIESTMANGSFVLGMDTSEAIGRDSIAGILTDSTDLSVAGGFTCNETNLIRFSNFLADLLVRYENITLIPERKSTGQMIVDALLLILPRHGQDPFRRIYNVIVDNHTEHEEKYKLICQPMSTRHRDIYDELKKYFGFVTSASSRGVLYSTVLQQAAKNAGHLVRDKALSKEIRELVVKKGRIDHDSSGHDDHVVAWLLSHWMLTLSKNLQHYGIDTNRMFTRVSDQGRVLTVQETFQNELQRQIKQELETVYDELSNCTDHFLVVRLEQRLRTLNGRLVDGGLEANSLNDLIQKAAETRKAAGAQMVRQRQSIDQNRVWGNLGTPGRNRPMPQLRNWAA